MRERIPSEIVGKVRAFRSRLQAGEDEWQARLDTVIARLTTRLEKRMTFRPNECIDIVRAWRTANGQQFGQRPLVDWLGDKKQFCVKELRLGLSKSRAYGWADDAFEDTICLIAVTTVVDGRDARLDQNISVLVSYSPHALMRFYQRAFGASDATLIDALWAPLHCKDKIIRTTRGESFPIPATGGHWFGMVTLLFEDEDDPKEEEGMPVLNIRTFHTHE